MTFERWYVDYMLKQDSPRLFGAEDLHACWEAAQFSLNNELSVAANEAAKAERRRVAMKEIGLGSISDTRLEEIIKKAQG